MVDWTGCRDPTGIRMALKFWSLQLWLYFEELDWCLTVLSQQYFLSGVCLKGLFLQQARV